MPEPTIATLVALPGKGYSTQIKMRLRDDEEWLVLLDPLLIERTRAGLARIIGSIDVQKKRIAADGTMKEEWLIGANTLQRYAKRRLDAMPPAAVATLSSSKEARAWRAFSARLADALRSGDQSALDSIETPYGGLTARQWLNAREQKEEASK